ncbi:hypothetical protein [Pseudomonas fulva]|uniref:hypothetical protein n=1 Tax=Pseudomonas fulva TaxID=47880 RepID=UPI003462BC51
MNDLDNTLKLFWVASPFILGFTALAMDLHIACSKGYATMTTALQRSPCLAVFVATWGDKSVRARILVVFLVAGAMTSPKYSIRKGALDHQDYDQFPSRLKIQIITASWLNTIAAFWLCAIWLIYG